ncbi:uncharacterized protein YjiS (DUF1127 family) [Rhodopseudomonas rhenobacensis]|uniref:Uncharacterized protein YjiS (DUF1127 family) n=1 Tax=Rhodopseudomonas rhenobacensis TaxID=87461 RepID=A0A7W7Z4B7_9BRAD|nr:hypothetical protein [Rhodopseudomonas rhenobacensis]MBB5047382.1 uncharacterized protein YjiS (DUF1127 family) [Rhodopseudomonas rhenobacensis]
MTSSSNKKPRATPVPSNVADVVREWEEIAASPKELEAFGRAMANMVKDLGLSPSELRALATKGSNAKELPCLLEALRISIRALAEKEPMLLNDLRRACASCEHKRECDADIAAGTLVPGYQRYCLNVQALDALQHDDKFHSES